MIYTNRSLTKSKILKCRGAGQEIIIKTNPHFKMQGHVICNIYCWLFSGIFICDICITFVSCHAV